MSPLPRIGPRRAGTARLGIALVVLAALTAAHAETSAAAAAPPAAAVDAAYPHKTVKKKEYVFGARSYWLFEPADPAPATAPVVVLNHGWLAVNPGAYGGWIEHLVRSGKV